MAAVLSTRYILRSNARCLRPSQASLPSLHARAESA